MLTLLQNTRAYKLAMGERAKGELSHAYLLHFPDARNLRTALAAFAKLFFNCQNTQTAETERIARLIDDEQFSDCLFFPEKDKKFVVEDAEKISEESSLKPVESDEKLFVICDFDGATPAAQNKLLKLLEEPPKGVRFLLGATTVFPVLSTVLSRVKVLEIPAFSTQQIVECLNREYTDEYSTADKELCAAACGGVLGVAQNMLTSGAYKSLVDDAFALAGAKEHQLPLLIKNVGDTKRKKELLSLLRIIWRDALLLKAAETKQGQGLNENVFLQTEVKRLKEIAGSLSLPALVYAQEAVSKAERQVTFNAYFPQCLQVLIASVRTYHV